MMLRGPAAVRRRPLARALAASALFLLAWSFLHVGVFERENHKLKGDVAIYQGYGEAMRHGQVPYRDVAIDYPPAALPTFIAPAWASNYAVVFEVIMLICGVVGAFLVGLAAPAWAAPLFAGVSPLLVGDLMRTRFDLWPVGLATGAVVALLRDRHRLGWALLAVAVAAKGYAVCLVPLAAVWTARRAGSAVLRRSAALGGGIVAAAFVPFFVVAPHGAWVSLWGQVSRPLQIESLGGAILMTARRAEVVRSHGSSNIAGVPAQILAAGFELVAVCALVWCWLRFARGKAEPERLCLYAAACVCAFVAFGKVLSPQYLIWLVPLVALVRGSRGLAAIGLLAAACLLTHWWIPSRYDEYRVQFSWAWVVLVRDLVLVLLFAVLAWPARRLRPAERRAALAPAR